MVDRKELYLDHNATTPLHPEALDAMLPYLRSEHGNPSSIHSFGQRARRAVETSRETIAHCIGARSADEIVFTGGGTESNNLAIKGYAWASAPGKMRLVTTAVEHHAVLNPCQYLSKHGYELSVVPVDGSGRVACDAVSSAIGSSSALVSVMHANNELGSIQPIEQIAVCCREHGALFHTDAVQTVGKLPIDVEQMQIDLLSASAHKFYGPKGVGFLYVRRGTRLVPLLHGGHHEKNRRAGTEHIAGIVGMAHALTCAIKVQERETERLTRLRDRLEAAILEHVPRVTVNARDARRLANTTNITFEFIEGEGIILALDAMGIAVSTGSACASGDLEPSHVLKAIGIAQEKAHGTVRFSLGRDTTDADIDYCSSVIPSVIARLRQMSPLWDDYARQRS